MKWTYNMQDWHKAMSTCVERLTLHSNSEFLNGHILHKKKGRKFIHFDHCGCESLHCKTCIRNNNIGTKSH